MTNATQSNWMLYGSYGTTGRLNLDEALGRGHLPGVRGVPRRTGDAFALAVPGTRIQELQR